MLPDLVKTLQVKNNDLFASALFEHWGKTTRKLVVIQLSLGCCKKWVVSMEVLKVSYPETFSTVLRNTCCKKFWKCIKVNSLLVLIFTTFIRIQEAGYSGVFIDNFQQIFTHFSKVFIVDFQLANSNWYAVFKFSVTTGLSLFQRGFFVLVFSKIETM